jgi:hypothetical protein
VHERPTAIHRQDSLPVDPYLGDSSSPDAMTAAGERVSSRELESAGELLRVAKRFRLTDGKVDGFFVYRAYRWIRERHPAAAPQR